MIDLQKTANAIRALGRMACLQKSLLDSSGGSSRQARSRRDHNANDRKLLPATQPPISSPPSPPQPQTKTEWPVVDSAVENGRAETDSSSQLAFTLEMRDTDVYNMDSARFDVKFSGAKGMVANVTWYKNDGELMESSKYSFRTSGERHSLIIRMCSNGDEGMYECKVSAGGQEIMTGAELYVAGTHH